MDFRGDSIITDLSGLQSQIDALNVRVTSLEGRMTTAETNITTLQSGIFSGRVYQFGIRHTPFFINELTNDTTMPNDGANWEFVTPDNTSLVSYYSDGSVFHFFTCGIMLGSNAQIQFCLSTDGLNPLGGNYITISPGFATPHSLQAECYLMIYNVSSPTVAKAKIILRGYSDGVAPVCQEIHNISINPSVDLVAPRMMKKDVSAFTQFQRTQGWVWCLQ
jgi:hypothetical protein